MSDKICSAQVNPLTEVNFVAKSRLREKELRRRRHRYWKRKKQRIKQAILEARLRKLEMKKQETGSLTAAEEATYGEA